MVVHFEEVGLERMSMNLKIFVKTVSPTYFEIIAQTYASISYSCPRLMVIHFEEVGLGMNHENFMDMRRPACFEIVARPPVWLLYSFLT